MTITHHRQKVTYAISFYLTMTLAFCTGMKKEHPLANDEESRSDLVSELNQYLLKHTLDLWYPRILDFEYGGYYSNFNHAWEISEVQHKFLVTQARHIWTTSRAYEWLPGEERYLEYAHHGYEFLRDHMWDNKYGGFVQMVDRQGRPIGDRYKYEKRAYGNAFAIYALAAYYRVTGIKEVLELAIQSFRWFDEHAHDSINGGYFEHLAPDGKPISIHERPDQGLAGIKDYNSSIHIMEAFAELYRVWPDPALRLRLEEMFHVILDKMAADQGYLRLYFYPNWTLVEDEFLERHSGGNARHVHHVTFGHDVETAFLLYETAEILGLSLSKAQHQKIKRLVDHALEHGWDSANGGFYDRGKYVDGVLEIIDHKKNWWGQAEGMNSLLMMSALYPEDTHAYDQRFLEIWIYIKRYLIDHEHLGWYSYGLDTAPDNKHNNKANIWKGTYHIARSMINCIERLHIRKEE